MCIFRSEVKERVVWVDTKKTQVKNKAGKLKEKEITILEVRLWDPIAGMWCDGSVWKSGDSESNLIFLFYPSGTRESPEARRQTAPGDPVQHRGPHWPLLLPHWNGYPALETDVCRSGNSLNLTLLICEAHNLTSAAVQVGSGFLDSDFSLLCHC